MGNEARSSEDVTHPEFARRPGWATLALAVAVLAASTLGKEDAEHFGLYMHCAPVEVHVLGFPDEEADAIGLTKDSVELAVRSRLRAARLYKSKNDSNQASVTGFDVRAHLWVSVVLTKSASVVRIEMRKSVHDIMSQMMSEATTWSRASLGFHGKDPSRIRGVLAEHMDHFVDAYLRVNEAACKAKDGAR